MEDDDRRPAAPEGRVRAGEAPAVVPAEALLAGGRQAFIEHNGERYVLRLTRTGKLVLNK